MVCFNGGFDGLSVQKRVELYQVLSGRIVDVQPELVELIWTRLGRVKPNGAVFRLAEFDACLLIDDQWRGKDMGFTTGDPPDQLHAGDGITPLVRSGDLQRDTHLL